MAGRRLLDWAGYYASKLIGHNHPSLPDPRYARRFALAANNKVGNPDFLTLECLEYYELLHSLAPLCMRNEALEVYALDSGAEAVENMLKPMEDIGGLDSAWGRSLADMVRFMEEMKVVRGEGLIEAVPSKADRLVAGLETLARDFPGVIHNVRGMGLYQGFSFRREDDKKAFTRRALQVENLLLLGAGTHTIRLRPNLEVTSEEIDLLLAILRRGLEALAAAND